MGRPHLGNRAGFVLFLVAAQLSPYSIWKFSVLCINYGVCKYHLQCIVNSIFVEVVAK